MLLCWYQSNQDSKAIFFFCPKLPKCSNSQSTKLLWLKVREVNVSPDINSESFSYCASKRTNCRPQQWRKIWANLTSRKRHSLTHKGGFCGLVMFMSRLVLNFRTLWRGEVELFVPPIGDGEREQEMGAILKRFLNTETERLSLQGPGRSIMWVQIEVHVGLNF